MKQATLLLLLFLAALAACTSPRKSSGGSRDLLKLKDYMSGTFNSAAQTRQDTDYFDITLHMVPIWTDRPGHWLYVEQAVTANQAKPYRQRIYQLEQLDGETFRSSVFTLHDEKAFVNAWQSPEKFKGLNADGIELKAGCEVVLKKAAGGTFSGSTGEKSCPSELRGAKYATSKVTVKKGLILSWDQGFNALGEQVWGATKGGYEFVKQ